jgi:hypothetical protein
MAALLSILLTEPQDELDRFGAGAKIYIARGTTTTVTDASDLTSLSIVAGTTLYEYADSAGTPGTDYYWFRTGKSTVATADDVSGWTGPILAGALSGGPLTLELVKNWNNVAASDTADDGWSPVAIAAINRAAIDAAGIDLGSSPDTTRTYDAAATVRNGTRLWVPGGIRAFTAVQTGDGTTWTTVTTTVRIGPLSHSRPTGEPGAYIEVIPGQTTRLDASYFIKVTGTAFATFGWDAWPMDLVQDVLAAYQRLAKDRDGQGAYPTETAAMRYLHLPLWHSYRDRYFPRVR